MKADSRNLQWKNDNVGSRLLAKMGGWQAGQAIGKRQRQTNDTTASGEGLRVTMRPQGLGLGNANTSALATAAAASASTGHVHDFTNVLASLQEQHGNETVTKKKLKKKKLLLPTNKMTHAKVRAAKFQPKSPAELACIFGGTVAIDTVVDAAVDAVVDAAIDTKTKRASKRTNTAPPPNEQCPETKKGSRRDKV